jgi:RNA recognition motif-containing protein
MSKLFVVGFPKDMEEVALLELFSLHGGVELVTIVTDKDTRQSKGYGFIHMVDGHAAQRAIRALDGWKIGERVMSVRLAEEKQGLDGDHTTGITDTSKTAWAVEKEHNIKDDGPSPGLKKKRPRISGK